MTSIHKMKICLRYLGDPGYQMGIGLELGVSQATASRTMSTVVDIIVAHTNEWIKFPTTNQEIVEFVSFMAISSFNFEEILAKYEEIIMNMERRNISSFALLLEMQYLLPQSRASYQFLHLYEFGPMCRIHKKRKKCFYSHFFGMKYIL